MTVKTIAKPHRTRRRSGSGRKLWEACQKDIDEKEVCVGLDEEMAHLEAMVHERTVARFAKKWSFDLEGERPIGNGNYQWKEVGRIDEDDPREDSSHQAEEL